MFIIERRRAGRTCSAAFSVISLTTGLLSPKGNSLFEFDLSVWASMTPRPLRAIVVDDSALYRKILRSILEAHPGVEVIGVSSDGQRAIDQIEAERPDFITLDLEMPGLDGLGVLREMAARNLPTAAIVVSTSTTVGAASSAQALQAGACDFIAKPVSVHLQINAAQLAAELGRRVEALRSAGRKHASSHPGVIRTPATESPAFLAPEVIGIGVSTGGPAALRTFLPAFAADFPCPILVVQHMPPAFTRSLADELDHLCALNVVEAVNGMSVSPGKIAIAPGGKQMRVMRRGEAVTLHVNDDPPLRNCRPSVDYMFNSLAETYGSAAWGAILTGMGDDGTAGSKAMKAAGSTILAQDEASCVVYGMPRMVVEAGVADLVGTLAELASHINAGVCRPVRA
jgi:two-component system chemotaxis response regulator CheB